MIIFVLRHADRSPAPSDGLSPAGVARAHLLAHMLSESGVSMAYCSDALRTQETLVPLKEALGDALTIRVVSAAGPGGLEAHVETIVAALKELPDSAVAVVVSHSNTVGPIIKGLGGSGISPIADNEFDKLFVLFGSANASKTLLHLCY